MKLGVMERLKLLEILPERGDISVMRTTRDIRKKLIFKEDEHIEFGIVVREPGVCTECGFEGYASSDGSCPRSVPKENEKPACSGGNFVLTGKQQINWNVEAGREVDIRLKAHEKGIVVTSLERLSRENGVTDEHITLYEKFLPDGE